MNEQVRLLGTEHWTSKGEVKLFMWNKVAGDPAKTKGTILFVHGSSMASQPTFDLEVSFLFPWAVAFGQLGAFGFWSMMLFLGVLTIGFIYEWKKGALEWD